MKAKITVACPASGKSTLAKELVDQGWVEINRDNIRFPDGVKDWTKYKFSKANEDKVTETFNDLLDEHMTIGSDIIISDTNLNKHYRDNLIKLLESQGYEVDLEVIHEEFEELLKRDTQRFGGVGYEVLLSSYIKLRTDPDFGDVEPYIQAPLLPSAFIVDIDGTIAKMKGRHAFEWDKVGQDLPIEHTISLVKSLAKDHKIIFMSGRDESCQEETIRWLFKHLGVNTVWPAPLFMRPHKCNDKDYKVKLELFNKHVRGKYNVLGAIDDRKQVIECCWKPLGVNVINVGNPAQRF